MAKASQGILHLRLSYMLRFLKARKGASAERPPCQPGLPQRSHARTLIVASAERSCRSASASLGRLRRFHCFLLLRPLPPNGLYFLQRRPPPPPRAAAAPPCALRSACVRGMVLRSIS